MLFSKLSPKITCCCKRKQENVPVQRVILCQAEKEHKLGLWDRKGFSNKTVVFWGWGELKKLYESQPLFYNVYIRKRKQL